MAGPLDHRHSNLTTPAKPAPRNNPTWKNRTDRQPHHAVGRKEEESPVKIVSGNPRNHRRWIRAEEIEYVATCFPVFVFASLQRVEDVLQFGAPLGLGLSEENNQLRPRGSPDCNRIMACIAEHGAHARL